MYINHFQNLTKVNLAAAKVFTSMVLKQIANGCVASLWFESSWLSVSQARQVAQPKFLRRTPRSSSSLPTPQQEATKSNHGKTSRFAFAGNAGVGIGGLRDGRCNLAALSFST